MCAATANPFENPPLRFCPKDFEFDIDKHRKMSYNIPRAERGVWRGSIAQLGEHLPYKQRVTGSSPVVPTILLLRKRGSTEMAR